MMGINGRKWAAVLALSMGLSGASAAAEPPLARVASQEQGAKVRQVIAEKKPQAVRQRVSQSRKRVLYAQRRAMALKEAARAVTVAALPVGAGSSVVERSMGRFQLADEFLERGLAVARQAQHQQAIVLLGQSLAARPGHGGTILSLMALHVAREDFPAALAVPLSSLSRSDPAASKVWVAKIWLVEKLRGPEMALAFLRTLPSVALSEPDLRAYEFSLLMRLGLAGEAQLLAMNEITLAAGKPERSLRWTMAALSTLLVQEQWAAAEVLLNATPAEAFGSERERERALQMIRLAK